MTRSANEPDKGASTEEVLRQYFISLGYFVVRGVPVRVGGDDITDIDLWLYNRHTPLSRERVNVDIKNKARAKAMERIFVARGIREAYGFDRSIVVTSDARPVVSAFGHQTGVTVFGGDSVKALLAKPVQSEPRLTEEALCELFDAGLGKLMGNWSEKLRQAKARLITHLGFAACNEWLDELPELFEVAATNTHRREAALRAAYLRLGMFLVSLDFAIAQIAFDGAEKRRAYILEGLQFGNEGTERFAKLATQAAQLAAAVTRTSEAEFRSALTASVDGESPRYTTLADLFSKGVFANALVPTARVFERMAYAVPLIEPNAASSEVRAVLGALADALHLNRTAVLG